MRKIRISQSLTKALGFLVCSDDVNDEASPYVCPRYIKASYVDGMQSKSTPAMNKGIYFESLCIGGGRGGKQLLDLPRKKNGNKTVDQERIESRVEVFKDFCKETGMEVNSLNVQFPLMNHVGLKKFEGYPLIDIWVRSEFDIFPAIVNEKLMCVDLKLTKDVNNANFNWDYPQYGAISCWGYLEGLATNQAVFYLWQMRNICKSTLIEYANSEEDEAYRKDLLAKYELVDDKLIELAKDANFAYLVYDYSKDAPGRLNNKFIEYEWNEQRAWIFDQLINRTVIAMLEFEEAGWVRKPNKINCMGCPLKHKCNEVYTKTEFIKK